MTEIRQLCQKYISEELYQIIISNARRKEGASKVKVRPIMIKNKLLYQASLYEGNQIFHENYSKEALAEKIEQYLAEDFRQLELSSKQAQVTVLVSRKGRLTIKEKVNKGDETSGKKVDLSHNKTKKYILQEGIPVPFLVDLGVQTAEGRIVKSRYDKFRQINRYLEFVADIMPALPENRTLNIIDFGCGKSYLTFALYYYMKVLCHRDIRVIGLDLKERVIENCNALAAKYGYEGLRFITGDVRAYTGEGQVDMVVTLHACDTATDYAIHKAAEWGAKVIFTVPCCQHEVNRQIQNEILAPILKYGLIKERMAALVTDAIRANLLEEQGYQVQVMEFIDMEHTPKNILIRAVKQSEKGGRDTGIREAADFLQVHNTLQQLYQRKS